MFGSALVVFVIARCPSAIQVGNFEKIQVYYLQDLGYIAHLGPHRKRDRERKWEGLGVEGGDWGFSMSLLVNLKQKSRNLQ